MWKRGFIHVWYVTQINNTENRTYTAVTRHIELLGNTMIDRVNSQQLQTTEMLSLYVALVARPIIVSCRQVALLSLHFIRNVLTVPLKYRIIEKDGRDLKPL